MWARWVTLALGVWLVFAPAVLDYVEPQARTNDVWTGAAVGLIAVLAATNPRGRLLNTFLGVWLVLAPFALGYTTEAAIANDVIVGLSVAALSRVPNWTGLRARRRVTV